MINIKSRNEAAAFLCWSKCRLKFFDVFLFYNLIYTSVKNNSSSVHWNGTKLFSGILWNICLPHHISAAFKFYRCSLFKTDLVLMAFIHFYGSLSNLKAFQKRQASISNHKVSPTLFFLINSRWISFKGVSALKIFELCY